MTRQTNIIRMAFPQAKDLKDPIIREGVADETTQNDYAIFRMDVYNFAGSYGVITDGYGYVKDGWDSLPQDKKNEVLDWVRTAARDRGGDMACGKI